MTRDEKVKYWLDIADGDLEVAEDLYKTQRWLYGLAEGCGLYEQMSEDQKDFINAISTYNIQARYPEYKNQLAQILNQNQCRYIIDTTKELQSWIKNKL